MLYCLEYGRPAMSVLMIRPCILSSSRLTTYSVSRIDVVDRADCLCSFDNGSCLYRDSISESFAFAIHDARRKDIATNSVGRGSLDDKIVGRYGLRGSKYI